MDQLSTRASASAGTPPDFLARLSEMLAGLPIMVYRFRNEGGWPLEYASKGCFDLTGYEPPPGSGRELVERASLVHAEDQQRVWDAIQAAIRDKRPYELVYRIRTATGTEKRVLDMGRGAFAPDGPLIAIEGCLTELKIPATAEAGRDRAEEHPGAKMDERRQHVRKLEAIGTLAAGIAHDFNNSLTAISGHVELAKSALEPDHPAVQWLEMVEQAAQQAAGVTQSLMTFCRGAAAREAPLNLGRFVADSTRLIRRVLPATVEIVQKLPTGQDLWVTADATRLQQMLMNIAINAQETMPDGGLLRITVRSENADPSDADRPSGDAVLIIQDTGGGTVKEVKDRLFEPFFTTGVGGTQSGLLGPDAQGVAVDVDAAPQRGTRVKITLPRCQPVGDRAEPHDRPKATQTRGESVIVVEDNDHVRSIMTSTLRAQGYVVLQARDGIQAMRVLEGHLGPTCVVVLDLDLPKRDGLSCLEEILRTRPDVAVVLVTGLVDFASDQSADDAVCLLRKPFPMSELADAVAEAMEKATVRNEVDR